MEAEAAYTAEKLLKIKNVIAEYKFFLVKIRLGIPRGPPTETMMIGKSHDRSYTSLQYLTFAEPFNHNKRNGATPLLLLIGSLAM